MTDRLADLVLASGVVEHVVRDLKGKTEQATVSAKVRTRARVEAAQQGADVAAGGEQRRRLRFDAGHVLVERRDVPMPHRLLPHLAGADLHHRVGEDGDHLGRVCVCGLIVGLREIKIADHDRRFVAEARSDGWTPAPHGRAVDDIVVYKRGGMGELDRHGGGSEPRQVVDVDPRREQDESRTDPLATRGEEIGHRSRDHVGIRCDQRAKVRLDAGEVGGDGSKEIGRVLYVVCFSHS